MYNNKAAFLGDPNFPRLAMDSSRGGQIYLYQDLYMKYSRLAFSRIDDRAIGIGGLEKRLISAFNTRGGFGVFDDGPGGGLLHGSLLWHRSSTENTLGRIVFSSDRSTSVPTWSWMAYKGAIDYLGLPFDGVEWERREVISPWTSPPDNRQMRRASTHISTSFPALTCIAQDFTLASANSDDYKVIFDIPRKTDGLVMKCVVMGRSKGMQPAAGQRHSVLIVSPEASAAYGGERQYERIGAGYMSERYIVAHSPGMPIKIV
ncbi:hypothetical protein DL769_009897 [Monosporascus sp. CRB-8-3]|nr:hypothetical protein DL769_009897 [Monosporascus sp. CRB-8-3]